MLEELGAEEAFGEMEGKAVCHAKCGKTKTAFVGAKIGEPLAEALDPYVDLEQGVGR